MGTGAVSRYNFNRSQKLVTVQKFAGGQMSVSGYRSQHDKLSRKQEARKNRDKKMTFIVRVALNPTPKKGVG